MVDSFLFNNAYFCCGLLFNGQKVSHRGISRLLLIPEYTSVLAVTHIGDEESMKIKIYSNSDKKCGDNVYRN